jgi:hypothetical protein
LSSSGDWQSQVSKASDDFPDPLTPVTTVSWFIGIENETFLRLLTRAPRTFIASSGMFEIAQGTRIEIQALSKPQMIP